MVAQLSRIFLTGHNCPVSDGQQLFFLLKARLNM